MCNQEENQSQRLILIVDSEKHFLSSLQRNLQEDFDIKIANTTEDAIAILDECTPAAIVIDWKTPKMGGRKFCQKLRSQIRFEYIPILVLSAYDNNANRPTSFQAGADEFLSKPVLVGEIREKVKQLVENQEFSKNLKAKLSRRKRSS